MYSTIIFCKIKKIIFLLSGFCVLAMPIANAQGNERTDTIRIESLLSLSFEDLMNVTVITPSKNAQKSQQAPATVMVVTGDQIRLRGYRNLAQILNDLPDFIINDKSDPQFYNTVGARGIFRQDYFVILLDGVRISSPTNEPIPFLENFPIYLAEQIEVVYGPGSALYGADAMAGVINIITKTSDGPDYSITATGGSQGYGSTTALIKKKLQNDLYLTLGGQYSYDAQPDFSAIYKNDYNMSSHESGLFNTNYGPVKVSTPVSAAYEAPIKAYNAYASINKDGFSMKVLHHYVAVPTSTSLDPDNGVYNKNVFYGHGITTGSTSYTTNIGKVKSSSTLVASFYQVDPNSNYRNLYGGMEPGYKYSTGSMIKAEEQVDYSFSTKLNLIVGVTYEKFASVPKTPELQSPLSKKGSLSAILLNSVSENNPSGIEAKLFPLTYSNIGSYVQAQYFPARHFSLTTGLRYDNNSRFGSTLNPRIGSVLNPFKNTTFKVMYGTAYWAPSPLVSFESYGSFYTLDAGNTYHADFWHLPNPDLKPVTSSTLELSVIQKVSTNLSVTLTTYASHIHNLIRDVADNGNTDLYNNKFLGWDVGYITVPFNQGLQKNYGGNLNVNSTFKIGKSEFNAYSSLSYLQGNVSDYEGSSKEIEQQQIVPWQFRIGVDGKINGFYFSARLLRTSKQRINSFVQAGNSGERQTIGGYALLNASAGYTFHNRARLFLNVSNALDQRYLNTLAWQPTDFNGSHQDPMRAMVGFSLDF